MKVYIGPHVSWFGPYQLAEKILFWKDRYKDDSVHAFGEKLANIKPLASFLTWLYDRKQRKVQIRVDGYDIWNADHTLALIIVPVLKKLKEQKHGSSSVDDEDVPEHLRSTAAAPLTEEEKNTGHADKLWEARWEWVLDEMIWTFEQHADGNWEEQYYSGETDYNHVKVEGTEYYEFQKGPNHTFEVDRDGMQKHRARMDNGRRLFAKYYEALWD
jgi:hypothetical protein